MSLLKSVATVSGYTMISRILGFIRDILIANFLGAGPVADAFFVAFRIPNMFRRLVAEGAFSAAFVPLLAAKLERDGKAAALIFASQALSVLFTALFIFTVLFMIFMAPAMSLLAPGFETGGERFNLAVLYTTITFPYLIAMAVVALLGGLLNIFYHFAAMAAAPILLNIILIGAVLIAYGSPASITGAYLSWGVAIAGLAQVIALIIACTRAGLRLKIMRPSFGFDIKRLLKLMLPGVLGAGVMQINILVGTIIASFLAAGSISYLYYADRVYQLPLGVIGIAIGTALLPLLSRQIRSGARDAANASMNRALEFSMLLTLPATVALILIPDAIAIVLFKHGAFDMTAARATADALRAFAVGLPAYVLVKILAPGFFAREDTTTPVVIGALAMVMNVALSLLLIPWLEHVGIALATALSSWFNAGALWGLLLKRGLFKLDHRLKVRLPKIFLSALIMGVLVWLALIYTSPLITGQSPASILGLLALIATGVFGYGVFAHFTGAGHLGELRGLMRKQGKGKQ